MLSILGMQKQNCVDDKLFLKCFLFYFEVVFGLRLCLVGVLEGVVGVGDGNAC